MPSVCLYFQVHQPCRLRRYCFFDVGSLHDYEDETENRRILDRVAEKCYLPAGDLLLRLIEKYGGAFRVAFSCPAFSSISWNGAGRMFWEAFNVWPQRDASSS